MSVSIEFVTATGFQSLMSSFETIKTTCEKLTSYILFSSVPSAVKSCGYPWCPYRTPRLSFETIQETKLIKRSKQFAGPDDAAANIMGPGIRSPRPITTHASGSDEKLEVRRVTVVFTWGAFTGVEVLLGLLAL